MAQSIQREPAFLRRKQVETRTGLSRSTIYQYIKDGVFPKSVPLGPRATSFRRRASLPTAAFTVVTPLAGLASPSETAPPDWSGAFSNQVDRRW